MRNKLRVSVRGFKSTLYKLSVSTLHYLTGLPSLFHKGGLRLTLEGICSYLLALYSLALNLLTTKGGVKLER